MAYNSTHLGLYNAITGTKIDLVPPNYSIVIAGLSQKGLQVAIANAEGEVNIYSLFNSKNKQELILNSKLNLKVAKHTEESKLVGMCFTAKDEHLIIVYTDGTIVSSANGTVIVGALSEG